MTFLDIVLLVIVGAFVFFGLFFGFFHAIGSLIGTGVSIFITYKLIDPVFDQIGFLLGGGTFARVSLFIALFLLISKLIGLVFWLLRKVFGILTWIPFATSIDRILGAVFGLIEGIVFIAVALFYAVRVLPDNTIQTLIEKSFFIEYLIPLITILKPFIPEF